MTDGIRSPAIHRPRHPTPPDRPNDRYNLAAEADHDNDRTPSPGPDIAYPDRYCPYWSARTKFTDESESAAPSGIWSPWTKRAVSAAVPGADDPL